MGRSSGCPVNRQRMWVIKWYTFRWSVEWENRARIAPAPAHPLLFIELWSTWSIEVVPVPDLLKDLTPKKGLLFDCGLAQMEEYGVKSTAIGGELRTFLNGNKSTHNRHKLLTHQLQEILIFTLAFSELFSFPWPGYWCKLFSATLCKHYFVFVI